MHGERRAQLGALGREPVCTGYAAVGRSLGKRLWGIKYLMCKVYFSLSQTRIAAPPECSWSEEQPWLFLCWFCASISLGAAAISVPHHPQPQHIPGHGDCARALPAAHRAAPRQHALPPYVSTHTCWGISSLSEALKKGMPCCFGLNAQ